MQKLQEKAGWIFCKVDNQMRYRMNKRYGKIGLDDEVKCGDADVDVAGEGDFPNRLR